MADLTRRQLIGATAVAGAAGTADAQAKTAKRTTTKRADVVVVGAGLAGLAAARAVVAAGKSVLVLEARDRVGGRTLNRAIGGGKVVEIGGQWVGPTQTRQLALAKELGVDTYPTYNDGSYIYYRNGARTPYSPATPVFGAVPPDAGAAEAALAITQLNQMAATVPREAPWTAPRAAEWDAQTFETWKLANSVSSGARLLLDLAIEAVWAAEPRDVSLLHVLFYIACAGDENTPGTLERLINTAGGAQERRFVGGSQQLSLRMAAALGARRILLKRPVRRIAQDGTGARVETDKQTVRAKQVIVALPLPLTARIDYRPQLPAARDQLTQRFPMGNVIKCMAVYDTPFWRQDGLAGQVTSDADPVRITFDNSPPDGTPGVMLGFIEGHAARVWAMRGTAERRAAVLANFTSYFGPKAREARDFVEMNWAEEQWTRGCYVGFTPPGVLLDYGPAIRAPHGHIHWAGAETATIWNGYMEGAVRSGERAAREALAAL